MKKVKVEGIHNGQSKVLLAKDQSLRHTKGFYMKLKLYKVIFKGFIGNGNKLSTKAKKKKRVN